MEDIIRKIISIDTNAKDILTKSHREMKLKEKQVRDDVEEMTNEAMEKARHESQAIYEDTICKAQEEGENIRQRAQQEGQALEERYQAIKDRLKTELFNKIFE